MWLLRPRGDGVVEHIPMFDDVAVGEQEIWQAGRELVPFDVRQPTPTPVPRLFGRAPSPESFPTP